LKQHAPVGGANQNTPRKQAPEEGAVTAEPPAYPRL